MWSSVETLKALSHALMVSTFVCAVIAAAATGARFYIDRRIGLLNADAQAQREAALRERIAVLSMQVEPRRLTTEQANALSAVARHACAGIPHIGVTAANSNNEAQTYALDFVNALNAAGCSSALELPIPGLTPDVVGIHIGVRAMTADSPPVQALRTVLNAAHVPYTVSPIADNFFTGAPFVLIVGAKAP